MADTYGGGEESSAVDVTVKYKVTLPPGGSFSVLKLVAKKDSMPNDISDGDKIVDLSPSKTKKTVTGLDENSLYYFKIFAEDTSNNTSESDEKHIMTSGDEGWSFDYTGSIQTFTAPKTGIYQLETWGAQGENATDGTNTARGGYGAYAVGEVLLQQGDTLYINVGGQNGYGGGGGIQKEHNLSDILINSDLSHRVSGGTGLWGGVATAFNDYKNSDYYLWTMKENAYATFPVSYSNGEYDIAISSLSEYGYLFVPFYEMTNITKVSLDMKTDGNSERDFTVYLVSKDFGVRCEVKQIYPVTNTNWTHYDIDISSEYRNYVFNYLAFTIVGQTTCHFKNVKINGILQL